MSNYDIYGDGSNKAPWYSRCSEIEKVVIKDEVRTIGDYAFYQCTNLTSIDIPNSVTSIGEYAFDGCSGLKSVTIPNSVMSIGDAAFSYCKNLTSITIPNSVMRIGYSAFNGCESLTSIEIPNSVTRVGEYAFKGCSGLTSVEIPNSVTSIGIYAFGGCSALTSIEIPNSITSIGEHAFKGCSGLTSVEIPNSVTSIGNYVFEGCSGLTSITVEKGNTKYDSRDNCNAIIETSSNKLIQGCKNTVIPNSVTSIGMGAFPMCSTLTSIEIPNSVTSIEKYAFLACEALASVEIPNSVTSIGDDAFGFCSGLISIEIPNSVTSIGNEAFYYCDNLISITFKGSTPPTFGKDVFKYVNNSISIYVPDNSVEAYKDALGDFASYIKEPIFLNDNGSYTQNSQIDGVDVSYTRNFTNTNWQAIYLPFSLKYEDWKDDFEVARINGIRQYDDYNIGSINRTELEVVKMTNDDSVIYPNTPYLIRARTPGEKTLSAEKTTVYESKANNIKCSTTTVQFTFIGTYNGMNFSGIGAHHNCYVLDSYGRNIIEGKSFLLPYRWFMKMDERESVYGIKNNTAKEISIRVVGEETTGIANIQHASPNTQTYDLNGRKVNENNLKPGMYIKNGRKVIVR